MVGMQQWTCDLAIRHHLNIIFVLLASLVPNVSIGDHLEVQDAAFDQW